MIDFTQHMLKITSFSVITFLAACSSGGSAPPAFSGNTSAAAISDTNILDLSAGASLGSFEAVKSKNANEGNPFYYGRGTGSEIQSPLSSLVSDIVKGVLSNSGNIATGITISATDIGLSGYCGGTFTFPATFAGGGTLNGSVVFSDVCFDSAFGGQIFMSGTVTFSQTATEINIAYTNFSVTIGSTTNTISNMTITCSTNYLSCTISSDFASYDGLINRIADFLVSGDGTLGYNVSADFYHHTHGLVSINISTPITFNCSNGWPDAGTIDFTSTGGSSASITFRSDCTGIDGTYNTGSGSLSVSSDWPV